MDCFERASLPNISDERRRKDLHFVIVGGGPTGVKFAAELNDFVSDDLSKLYPTIRDLVKITVIEAGEHVLTMFDRRITKFAEEKFQRDGIDVKTGFKVFKVSDQDITMKSLSSGETSVPYGMVVWSTGIGTRPVILDSMKQIDQANRRVLATDEWLRVLECDDVYAIGDCATISQRKVMDWISKFQSGNFPPGAPVPTSSSSISTTPDQAKDNLSSDIVYKLLDSQKKGYSPRNRAKK